MGLAGQSDKILILTQEGDVHACAVDLVLAKMGFDPILYVTTDFLVSEHISIDYRPEGLHVRLGTFSGYISDIKSVWHRRVSSIFALPDNLHPADETHIQSNARAAQAGLVQLFDDKFIVNASTNKMRSNKLLQLHAAAACGLRVPRTLFSNRYDDVVQFVSEQGDTCMKSQKPHSWYTDDGYKVAVTHRLEPSDIMGLLSPPSCSIGPMIYQEYIEKKFEYRVTMFGDFCATTRINSKVLEHGGSIDWRMNGAYLDNLSICDLPDHVLAACKRFLDKLGLRFGTLDLAETPEGEFVFFEVNESGQWLWQELHCPDCYILQPFCQYLAEADDAFRWDDSQRSDELSAAAILRELESNRMPRYDNVLQRTDYSRVSHFSDERTNA